MNKRIALVLMMGAMLLLSSCQSQAETALMPIMSTPGALPIAEEVKVVEEREAAGNGEFYDASLPLNNIERMVIKNAELTIFVADPAAAIDQIASMAGASGGYIVSSNTYMTYNDNEQRVPEGNIPIRVPADQLDATLDKIKALVSDKNTDIINERVSGQDVTQEYTDLSSRLRNLEEAEKQLLRFMNEANDMEDVLSIYRELVNVQQQIEVIKGQMQYYEQSSALSAISVVVRSQESIAPLTIGGWQPVGVARDAIQALISTLRFLANVLIWLVLYFAPVAVLLFFPIRAIVRKVRRNRAAKKAAAASAQPPEEPNTK
jgi:hypothetical protein